ncbi:hypothetical protein SAMN06297251_103274 [Fulvimarina manganoxydans]|uniref:DNA gyrase inhibitor YacG n=1 Tax=Fulvimarina manganoxydans TaxID=937218 RepID=A0A1W2A0P6_9HYPH|nr:DNA gyrase inhibitor YacG [Fulvimarina manganoxydans]MCK5931168.1 DNA gyrase inhibitor YacG [Fulvimarina manganoxydans]MEE2951989.1 DNA gyrase inhibitor YacG [Pseudomonadota bacterium]SMC54224.1 hypothetical protein SAMN06297251_103274 [Fulvimarina manganoxydans]
MSGDNAKVTPLRPKRRCPECGRAADRVHFPFCSDRCKSVDLNRWLSGRYVIPGPAVSSDQGHDAED